MSILGKGDSQPAFPNVLRWTLVDGDRGAETLRVSELTYEPGGTSTTHYHPTEEAMVILEGEMEALLGDDIVTVNAGDTVLAPAGVKHRLANRSGSIARVMAIFPTIEVESTTVD